MLSGCQDGKKESRPARLMAGQTESLQESLQDSRKAIWTSGMKVLRAYGKMA